METNLLSARAALKKSRNIPAVVTLSMFAKYLVVNAVSLLSYIPLVNNVTSFFY